MLNTVKILKGYTLYSLDGEIGKVDEFYFDDQHWAIRYLIVDTGDWLIGRQVLLSPYAVVDVNKEEQYITVELSKKQIEDSPSLESDTPISRQFEEIYYGHYGWPVYWGGPHMWGAFPYIMRDRAQWRELTQDEETWNPHLRSTRDVTDYTIQATDGEIGHVVDFIIDDEMWMIRYLIIDTQNWGVGEKVLIAPQWIERISWEELKVFVNLTSEAIKQSPEYTRDSLTREYETALHCHYNRQEYWGIELIAE